MTECKALMKYVGPVRYARAMTIYSNGHEFKRELDWCCSRCGRKRGPYELVRRGVRCLGRLGRLLSFFGVEPP